MRIEVRKNKEEWTVIIGCHAYQMNAHADRPDGVCDYVGAIKSPGVVLNPQVEEVPIGIVRKIVELVEGAICGTPDY